nr:uncharacterized protein LOC105326778 [Crassostrea gigas]
MFILFYLLVNGMILISAIDKWLTINCPGGFYGVNCEKNCPYPNYGKRCSQICDCSELKCNNIFGCLTQLETKTPTHTPSNSKPITQDDILEAYTIYTQSLAPKDTKLTADTVTVTDETIVPTVTYRWNQSDWVTRSIYGTGVLIIILVLFHISISVLRCVKIKGTLENMQSSTT